MFNIEFNAKTMIIAGAIALATATVTTAAYMWFTQKAWSVEEAEKADEALLDAYNDAVTTFPSDRAKATFMYEAAVGVIRETFKAQNGQFEEYAEWELKFNEVFKAQKAAMRKA